jgi:hypothetical protein
MTARHTEDDVILTPKLWAALVKVGRLQCLYCGRTPRHEDALLFLSHEICGRCAEQSREHADGQVRFMAQEKRRSRGQ